MHQYVVGQLYHPERRSWPQGGVYQYRGQRHELVIFLADLTAEEIRAIRQGPTEFALVTAGDVILLLYRFGDVLDWSDAPFSIHLVAEAERLLPPEPVQPHRELLTTLLVDATTGIIRAIRVVSLGPAFVAALHEAILAQARRPWPGRVEYDAQVDALYRLPSERLVERATIRTPGGV